MAVVAAHDIQNVQRAGQIVGVVLDGLGNALADGLVGGELDDTVNVLVLGKDLLHGVLVGHVGLDKTEVLAGDLLDAGQGLGAGVVVVIGYCCVRTERLASLCLYSTLSAEFLQ